MNNLAFISIREFRRKLIWLYLILVVNATILSWFLISFSVSDYSNVFFGFQLFLIYGFWTGIVLFVLIYKWPPHRIASGMNALYLIIINIATLIFLGFGQKKEAVFVMIPFILSLLITRQIVKTIHTGYKNVA